MNNSKTFELFFNIYALHTFIFKAFFPSSPYTDFDIPFMSKFFYLEY